MNSQLQDTSKIFTNVGNNFQVYYKDFNLYYTHFIPYPYLDIVSQALALIGTIATIGFITKKNFRDLLLVYLSTVIVLGVTNPYSIPPTSRGMMLVIFGFVFAAIGLSLINKINGLQGRVILPVLCVIIILNIYQAQYDSFKKIGYTSMALVFKSIQEAHVQNRREVVLVLSEKVMLNSSLYEIPKMQEAYGLKDVTLTVLRPNQLSCSGAANKKVIVFNYDSEAMQWLKNNQCSKNSNYPYEALSTNIWYY
jgi:hypothetical protein